MSQSRIVKGLVEHSELTCPICGHRWREGMPIVGSLASLDCPGCGVRLQTPSDGCCIFCTYGDWPCPPSQRAAKSFTSGA